jgi:hypothetical protein
MTQHKILSLCLRPVRHSLGDDGSDTRAAMSLLLRSLSFGAQVSPVADSAIVAVATTAGRHSSKNDGGWPAILRQDSDNTILFKKGYYKRRRQRPAKLSATIANTSWIERRRIYATSSDPIISCLATALSNRRPKRYAVIVQTKISTLKNAP